MPTTPDHELTFEDFKKLAADPDLNAYEKIGFPTSYRRGKEHAIFRDIICKLPNLEKTGQTVIEIGPGCSGPAFAMIDLCRANNDHLIIVDSQEMLDHLPDGPKITKIAGRFPDCADRLDAMRGRANVILCYSVFHYIFHETNMFAFLDASLMLLAHSGQMLIGDIPNVSKRKRFFASPSGKDFHRRFTNTDSDPEVVFNQVEAGKIDDAVLLSILLHSRSSGCDAYLVAQPVDLPMANRREDILICKP